MKLTGIQKKAIVIWFFSAPLIAFTKFYMAKPSFLSFFEYWQKFKSGFFDHLILLYLVIGFVCLLLFFLMKDKPNEVLTQEKVDQEELEKQSFSEPLNNEKSK